MRISVVLAFGAVFGFHTAAAAQETAPDLSQSQAECLCELPTEAAAQVATIQDIVGQVLLSDAVGYTPIHSATDLSVGDRVILLSDARAALIAGSTCHVALAPDSTISLIPTEAGVCVAHASTAQDSVAVVQPAADLPPPMLEPQPIPPQPVANVAPALVGAGLFAAGMAAIILLDEDDAPPRPVSP